MTERELFKVNFSKPPYEFELDVYGEDGLCPGNYVVYHVECSWQTWQTAYNEDK